MRVVVRQGFYCSTVSVTSKLTFKYNIQIFLKTITLLQVMLGDDREREE